MIFIGLKIRGLMSKEKMDAPALAKRLNKSKQAVYDMLEKQDLSTSVLRELADIFHVPLTYFLTEENNIFTESENSVNGQEEVAALKQEIASLKSEIARLQELKLPTTDAKALDVSMKFFEAAKEMFTYYKQIKGE